MRRSFVGIHFATEGCGLVIRQEGDLLGCSCPEGFAVGRGVSEVIVAFVASLATGLGSHDDPAKTVIVPAGRNFEIPSTLPDSLKVALGDGEASFFGLRGTLSSLIG
jgi:hypothetical protein